MNWKVGDIAVFHGLVKYPELNGLETQIVEIDVDYVDESTWHECIDMTDKKGIAWFRPVNLRPIYDGNELSTWDECAFKPKEFVT